MLARFRQFRRILLTEQRAWRERLVFAFSLGIPLAGGVTARLLLDYEAADCSLVGPFPGRPARRSLRRGDRRRPARRAGARGRRGGGDAVRRRVRLRGRRPARGLPQGVDLALCRPSSSRTSTATRGSWSGGSASTGSWRSPPPRRAWRSSGNPWACGSAPSTIFHQPAESLAHGLPDPALDRAERGDPDQDLEHCPHRTSPGGTGEPPDGRPRRGADESDQPALPLQHAHIDLVAHPLAAGDGAHADRQAVGAPAAPAAQPGAVRHAARRSWRRWTSTWTSRRSASVRR